MATPGLVKDEKVIHTSTLPVTAVYTTTPKQRQIAFHSDDGTERVEVKVLAVGGGGYGTMGGGGSGFWSLDSWEEKVGESVSVVVGKGGAKGGDDTHGEDSIVNLGEKEIRGEGGKAAKGDYGEVGGDGWSGGGGWGKGEGGKGGSNGGNGGCGGDEYACGGGSGSSMSLPVLEGIKLTPGKGGKGNKMGGGGGGGILVEGVTTPRGEEGDGEGCGAGGGGIGDKPGRDGVVVMIIKSSLSTTAIQRVQSQKKRASITTIEPQYCGKSVEELLGEMEKAVKSNTKLVLEVEDVKVLLSKFGKL